MRKNTPPCERNFSILEDSKTFNSIIQFYCTPKFRYIIRDRLPDKVILEDPLWLPANEIDHHLLDLRYIVQVDPDLNLVVPGSIEMQKYYMDE